MVANSSAGPGTEIGRLCPAQVDGMRGRRPDECISTIEKLSFSYDR